MSEDRWAELEQAARDAQDAEVSPTAWFTAGQIVALAAIEPEDALFIAAANPATVLELIAAARQQSPENKEPGT